MYRAAVSASLDIIRRRRSVKASAARLDDVHPSALADARAGADERIATRELAQAVHDALELLAESRRGVVRMYLAGYDRYEIADLLGWTEGKTRNLLYRGLEDLRKILASRGITREKLAMSDERLREAYERGLAPVIDRPPLDDVAAERLRATGGT